MPVGEIKWNSQIVCLTFITNSPFYLQIIDSHEDETINNIKCLVNNLHLHREAKKYVQPIETSCKNPYKVTK